MRTTRTEDSPFPAQQGSRQGLKAPGARPQGAGHGRSLFPKLARPRGAGIRIGGFGTRKQLAALESGRGSGNSAGATAAECWRSNIMKWLRICCGARRVTAITKDNLENGSFVCQFSV
ncbi:uncharacterized protein LOC101011970 [Papio anubis]|uniref:uncharacterized protein LOC101011970 n=1 Tax=Papio anubis TaxID=9555 RepID=UPI0012AD5A9F|nr:uncharacterized protein LOC101011970 [Papio anubis]